MFATYAAPRHGEGNSGVFYGGKEPIFTAVSLRQNRARLASGIRLRSSRAARLSGSRRALKMHGRGRCIHQPRSSTSVFAEFPLYFSRFSTYARTYIPWYPCLETFPRLFCLAALFPAGAEEERTLFPSGPPSRSTTSSNDSFFFLDNLS